MCGMLTVTCAHPTGAGRNEPNFTLDTTLRGDGCESDTSSDTNDDNETMAEHVLIQTFPTECIAVPKGMKPTKKLLKVVVVNGEEIVVNQATGSSHSRRFVRFTDTETRLLIREVSNLYVQHRGDHVEVPWEVVRLHWPCMHIDSPPHYVAHVRTDTVQIAYHMFKEMRERYCDRAQFGPAEFPYFRPPESMSRKWTNLVAAFKRARASQTKSFKYITEMNAWYTIVHMVSSIVL